MVYAIKGIHDIQEIKETSLSVCGNGRNAEIVKKWLGKQFDQTSQNIVVIQDRNNRICSDFQCNRGDVYIMPDCVVDEIVLLLNDNLRKTDSLTFPSIYTDLNNSYYADNDSHINLANYSYVRECKISSWGHSNIYFGESSIINGSLIEAEDNAEIIIDKGVYISKGTQIVARHGSKIYIGTNCTLGNDITIIGIDDSKILVGVSNNIDKQCEFVAKNGGKIVVGKGTSISKRDRLGATNRTINIGDDCLLSFDIAIEQNHKIYDNIKREYIIDRKNTYIGDNVWIGKGAFIQSGAEIGGGSIVGAMSFVNGIFPANSEIVGSPAKTVKRNVQWEK